MTEALSINLKQSNITTLTKNKEDPNQSSMRMRRTESEQDSLWREIKTPSTHINCRYHHSSIMHQGNLLVFGGFNHDIGILNDFHMFDKEVNKWVRLPTEGGPGPRHSHSAILYNEKMYIFGGKIDRFNSTNSVHSYCIKEKKWTSIETTETSQIENAVKSIKPGPIDSHQSVVIGDEMIVYGGFCENEFTNNICALNLKTFNWRNVYSSECPQNEKSKQQQEPEARSDFSLVAYSNNLYIFAGKNLNKSFSNFWEFNMETSQFKMLSPGPEKQKNELRSGHSAVVYKNFMLVFGGISSVTHERDDLLAYCFKSGKWGTIWKNSAQSFINAENDETPRRNAPERLYTSKLKGQDNSLTKSKIEKTETEKYKKYRRPLAEEKNSNVKVEIFNDREKVKKHNERKILLINEIEGSQPWEQKYPEKFSPLIESLTNSILLTSNGSQLKDVMVTKALLTCQTDEALSFRDKRLKARDGHTAHISGGEMVIFGGDRHMIALNDIVLINIDLAMESLSFEPNENPKMNALKLGKKNV